MLGRTAGSLFWMFRYLERMETTARLLDAGFQISLTRGSERNDVWESVVSAAGVNDAFLATYDEYTQANVVDFLLRDDSQPYSARAMLGLARDNARAARTALTSEIWQAVNGAWLETNEQLRRTVKTRDLPKQIGRIQTHSQHVRGALHGTMLRNDIYDFLRLGNFIERFEATARILDVKYYVLLPSVSHVGSSMDNIQWETILRSASAYDTYRWLNQGQGNAVSIVNFLILDGRFPRSMRYSLGQNYDHICYLCKEYGEETRSLELASELVAYFETLDTDRIFAMGLHEFLQDMIARNVTLATQIETDYRFYR